MAITSVRDPAVSGKFYPANRAELESAVDDCLSGAATGTGVAPGAPKALIAPHAGYAYSGPVAGSAFVAIESARLRITRVVLLGPSHWVAFKGIAATEAQAFVTPLGEVPIDLESVRAVLDLPQVIPLEEAHRDEHCLEVELPFLQRCLDRFVIVPLVIGNAEPGEVKEVLDVLWGGEESLIVVSSDLSHYRDYNSAREIDRRTCEAIENLDPEGIAPEQACGRLAIQGLILAARERSLTARVLDLRNSGDTAGRRDRVVGYGAFAFS